MKLKQIVLMSPAGAASMSEGSGLLRR